MLDEISQSFVTVKDACDQLGICPNTLRSWSASGKIDEYRHPINNYRLYRRADIEALRRLLAKPIKVVQDGRQGKHA